MLHSANSTPPVVARRLFYRSSVPGGAGASRAAVKRTVGRGYRASVVGRDAEIVLRGAGASAARIRAAMSTRHTAEHSVHATAGHSVHAPPASTTPAGAVKTSAIGRSSAARVCDIPDAAARNTSKAGSLYMRASYGSLSLEYGYRGRRRAEAAGPRRRRLLRCVRNHDAESGQGRIAVFRRGGGATKQSRPIERAAARDCFAALAMTSGN